MANLQIILQVARTLTNKSVEGLSDRLQELLDSQGNIAATALSKELFGNPERLRTVIADKRLPQADVLAGLKSKFPQIDLNWLVSGVGQMFLQPTGSSAGALPLAVTVDQHGEENIVVVEPKARAGYVNGLGDPTYLKRLPAYRLPYLHAGTFRDFTVEGFSMYNPETGQIMQGSHVISRFIGGTSSS